MKTNVFFSKLQGKKDDAKLHTVSEFCRIVANDCCIDIYGYFSRFYSAYISDIENEKKNENENRNDFLLRVQRKAENKIKRMKTAELRESNLFKIFSSKNQLFKLIRTISPCFYDENGNHQFARIFRVATNTSKLTREQIADLLESGNIILNLDIPGGKKVEIVTKLYQTENGLYSETLTKGYYYNKLGETRKQRKEKFAELKESSVFFWDKDNNICTLKPYDKMNFQMLYSYISEYAQRENFARVQTQQQKEKKIKSQKETIKANSHFDEQISKSFNKLFEYRNKVKLEHKNTYIQDENTRNLVTANFIKLITEYKLACKKRFPDWKESENDFLADTKTVFSNLTEIPLQTKKTTKKTTKKVA